MNNKKYVWTGFFAAIAMFVLIIDTKTALSGAEEGISLCIYTIIPSLFPFIVLSVMINGALIGTSNKALQPIGRLCGVPAGAESLLLLGFLGGYPVGAQSIYQSYRNGQLDKSNAKKMLGFCNNAGPAFIFGMVGSLFSSPSVPWIIWCIHVVSALLTGICLRSKTEDTCIMKSSVSISVTQALERGIRITATICGWVILFRIILAICNHWFLWILPIKMQHIFYGLLELSNGCYALQSTESPGMRFVFCSGYLAFGGLCVAMQTKSVTGELGTGAYFRGKILQCSISLLIASTLQYYLFPKTSTIYVPIPVLIIIATLCIIIITVEHRKKVVAILQALIYNKRKHQY